MAKGRFCCTSTKLAHFLKRNARNPLFKLLFGNIYLQRTSLDGKFAKLYPYERCNRSCRVRFAKKPCLFTSYKVIFCSKRTSLFVLPLGNSPNQPPTKDCCRHHFASFTILSLQCVYLFPPTPFQSRLLKFMSP